MSTDRSDAGTRDPKTARRTSVALWKRIALAAGSLVLTALVCEGATRLLLGPPTPVRLRDGVYVTQLPMVNGRDTVSRVAGTPLPVQKRPGEIRVFVFGESSVEGVPWGHHASPVTMLRDHMRVSMPARDITVVNMGRGASTTLDAWYFLTTIERFAPDVVIFYQGGNDFFYRDRERCLPATHPRLHATWRWLVERSRLLWSIRALGPAAYVRLRSAEPSRADVTVSAALCDDAQGFQAWSDILVTTARRMHARVIVTTPVQNPLRWAEQHGRWGVDRALDISGRPPSYRRLLECVLSPGCDIVARFGREQAVERYAPLWVARRGVAWRASAATAGAPVIDFGSYLDRNAAAGLRPALFTDEVHLAVQGYWALSWLWSRQLGALLGGPPFESDAAPLPPPVDRERYLAAVASYSHKTGACILLHDVDTYLRANMPLLAAHLATSAVALEVGDPAVMASSRAGLTAQLVLGRLRRELEMDPALPPLLASRLGEVRLDELSRQLREHRDCSTVGGSLLASIATEAPAAEEQLSFMIRPGQEGLVGAMLGAGASFDGCTLEGATIPGDRIHAVFRCAANQRVAVDLLHPSITATALATTRRFALVAGQPPPSQGMIEQLAANVRQREHSFTWSRSGPVRTAIAASASSTHRRPAAMLVALALAAVLLAAGYYAWRRRRATR